MKIIFLCGSLEPGRDGVGDYTRRLAGSLIIQGWDVTLISLYDSYVKEFSEATQDSGNGLISVLRCPAIINMKIKIVKIRKLISEFKPIWISLQYVPFSFNTKGLHFGLARCLNSLDKKIRWHIMFHELWVGMDEGSSLKMIYWGSLQKTMIKKLITKLKPIVIHTHSNLYIKMLEKLGFKAYHLPLFGNIPVVSKVKENDLIDGKHHSTQKVISFVVFGNIHHGAPIDAFANEAMLYKINNGINIVLIMIGRCGTEQAHWERTWRKAGLPVEVLGEQTQGIISNVLSRASFGISTTPAILIEKSGTVAAMREHGLNILCISRPWQPRGFPKLNLPEGITQYKEGKLQELIKVGYQKDKLNIISTITRQMAIKLH